MIIDKDLPVLGCRKEGISLPLSMTEHCLAKKELNNLFFFFEIGCESIFVKKMLEDRVFFIIMEKP